MVLKMFIIRDTKGGYFHSPRFLNTHAEAEREFSTLANDPKTMVGMYPEDFDLYYCGEWDNKTGQFLTKDTPEHMHKGITFVRNNKEATN